MDIVLRITIGLLILLGLYFVNIGERLKKVKYVVIILMIFLLYFTMVGVFRTDSVDLSSPKGVVNAIYVYVGWIGETLGNLWAIGTDTFTTVGNAIRIDKNETKYPR